MKAVICTKYGPPEVLKISEVDKPVPGDNEVLIKIHVTTAHIGDTKIRSLKPGMGKVKDFFFKPVMRLMLGINGPRNKILGMDLAGEIVEVGSAVNKFKVGDSVFASSFEKHGFSAYAEYICLSHDSFIVKKPENISYSEVAPLSNGGLTALLLIERANIKAGDNVLIYGASGSVGTYAVQLAHYFGGKITGVCSSANFDLVKSLGATNLIDYQKEDFSNRDEQYDCIIDTMGLVSSSQAKRALRQNGIYLNLLTFSLKPKLEGLILLGDLITKNKLKTVIDRTYPLDEIVEAHRYVEKGHKKGNVIIKIS